MEETKDILDTMVEAKDITPEERQAVRSVIAKIAVKYPDIASANGGRRWKYPSEGDRTGQNRMMDIMFHVEHRKGWLLFLPTVGPGAINKGGHED